MATVNPEITDPELRAMLGLPPLGADPLEAFLEQALDPVKRQSLDLSQYTQGVDINPNGISNQQAIDQNLNAANTVLSKLYSADPSVFRGGSFTPWSSFGDWNTRQNTREGFNEGSDLGSFVSGGVQHLGDTAGELLQEPGVLALLAAGTGGALMGAGGAAGAAAAPSAAAGGGTIGTGLTAGAGGASGLSTAAAGAGGITAPATGLGALSSGFFGSESLYPVVGGVTAGTVAGNVAGNAAGSAAAMPSWQQIAAGAIPAAFGAYGANQQANAYEGLARDYMNMGAPYRSKLSDLYANPSGFLNSPEVTVPVQQGTNALARALSVNGNPIGSGTALQELQNYSSNQLFSRLGQEKDRLAGFGGLSAYNQAAPQASANAIDANYNTYAALGRGSANVFNPPQRYNLPGLAGLY